MSHTSPLGGSLRSRARMVLVAIFAWMAFAPGFAGAADVLRTGDLDGDEKQFLRTIIFDLGYTDLARTWIAERQDARPSADARGDLDYALADCLQVEGQLDEFKVLIKELQKRHPRHDRSQAVSLLLIRAALAGVLGTLIDAQQAGDSEERAAAFAKAEGDFQANVVEPTNRGIESLNAQVEKLDDGDFTDKGAQRDEWEHFRVDAYKLYSERLPDGSPEAKRAWEQTLAYAEAFCEERYVNKLFLYEAQLFRGIALAALGQNEEAAEIMELLAEVEPDSMPPYPQVVVNFVRELRMRGMINFAQTFNAAGEPDKVVALFDRLTQYPSEHFPYRKDPETPALLPFRVQAEVEEAIARSIGGDNPAKGFALFRTLLDRFSDPTFVEANPTASGQYMVEVGKGLSRLIEAGAGGLPPEFYYRAGIGFKGRGKYERALDAFKLCIAAGAGSSPDQEWLVRSSWEIAETHQILGRILEAAVGYLAHLDRFEKLGKKNIYNAAQAAQNAFVFFGQFADEEEGEDAFDALAARGKELFELYGSGVAAQQSSMTNGYERELRGEYMSARKEYQKVERTANEEGRKVEVPFFYDAQVSAARCLYLESQAKADSKLEEEAIGEFKSLAQDAKSRANERGQAAARYELGVAYWSNGEGDPDKVIEVLSVLEGEVGGTSDPRRAGIYLLLQAQVKKGDMADATRSFELLSSTFPGHVNVAQATMFMIDGYRTSGTESDLKQVAQYAIKFLDHPQTKIDELPVPFIGELASYFLQGDETKRALDILRIAQKRVDETGDEYLQMIIQFRLAQAANAEGNHQEAIDTLTGLIESSEAIQLGAVDEAPEIHFELGRAYLNLYEDDQRPKILESARSVYEPGVAILQDRVKSFKVNGKPVPTNINIAFWQGYLQLLKIYELQEQYAYVAGTIADLRVRSGGKDFAPGALQQEFDRLEESAKKKKKK